MKTSLVNANLINRLQNVTQALSLSPAIARQFTNGQQLEAVVISQPKAGITHLNINGQVITTNAGALTLTPGQILQLKVQQTLPALQLRIISDLGQTQTIAQGLRQALPLQHSHAPLLANLLLLNNPQYTKAFAQLPPQIKEQGKKLLAQIADVKEVSNAKGLKKALHKSGLFFESNALQAAQNKIATNEVMRDFKALRLQLLAALKHLRDTSKTADKSLNQSVKQVPMAHIPRIPSAPPLRHTAPIVQPFVIPSATQLNATLDEFSIELFEQVRASLARTELTQLGSLRQEPGQNQYLIFELPIHNKSRTDIFHMVIQEQESQNKGHQEEKVWTVTMAFELEHLGPMQVVIQYQKPTVSASFWTEFIKAKDLLNANLNQLKDNLQGEGIDIHSLQCLLGTDKNNNPPGDIDNNQILDVQA